MKTTERIKMVKAMEFLARQINDDEVFDGWLTNGVADGDILYGDLTVNDGDAEELEIYLGDEEFADLMNTFLRVMKNAQRSGGLYCDDVISKEAQ